jgi:hypothetical protein
MEENSKCPFIVPVVADHLWLVPVSGYCSRTEDLVRVPGSKTFARWCMTSDSAMCPGYQQSLAATVGLLWGARAQTDQSDA